MVLNIFPRRKESAEQAAAQPSTTLPEPSPEALEQPARRTIRRVAKPVEAATEAVTEPVIGAETAVPAPRARRAPRAKPVAQPEAAAAEEPEAAAATVEQTSPDSDADAGDRPPSRRRRRGRGGGGGGSAPAASAPSEAAGELSQPLTDGSTAGILRAIERQGRQIEQIVRMQEEQARRGGGGGAVAPAARVGIFVDVANVELASDRLRARFDWKKILDLLTKDRTLVRAIAYCPVHDDPGVSIETQRFVEPFLDRGYKIVTKPLKRFQDGSVKANVDIELALDVIEMLDRLDVVCLISGDGDFQRLVEVVQAKGIRVEVIAVGTSTAANLRHAADLYIDLQGRLKDVRL